MSGYPTAFVAANPLPAADLNASFLNVAPIGAVHMFIGNTAPTSYLLCDGSAVSRATYASLFALICATLGTFTVTIASPAVVTLTGHGLATGDSVYLTTSGALPTGLAINTRYWVIKVDANTFNLASSLANALAGTKINTSGSQSGTHTATLCPFGLGDGSTTFNIPNLKGSVPVGKNQSDAEFAGLGQNGGEKTHTLTQAETPAHTHTMGTSRNGGGGGWATDYPGPASTGGSTQGLTGPTGSVGSDGSHNNLQPYLALNFIIRAL